MRLLSVLKQLRRYPAATCGGAIIVMLIAVSIHTVITIPYSEAVALWRGGKEIWQYHPKTAWPEWINHFPGVNRPTTIILCSTEVGEKTVRPLAGVAGGTSEFEILLPFDFTYDGFPQEITLFFTAEYDRRPPNATLTWLTPDGREINLWRGSARGVYRMSVDRVLTRRLGGRAAHIGLFADPDNPERSLKGEYTLRVEGWLLEENADLDARLVVFGQVHGLAGTDHLRRCLMVALLWGIPIALGFGAVAAVFAGWSTFILAAIGTWHGKWLDGIFQWLVQVNMLLPMLPILIMVGMFITRSLVVIIGVIIIFSVFSGGYFGLRAIFLQVKESPYIDAARAYGAGSWRIIFRYMIPKIIPTLVPGFVMAIPGFVFLEASLAVLGLGDPHLPTLGKLIYDAQANAAIFNGHYYWLVLPGVVLLVIGFSFCMVGYTLDRIINPRLRQI